MTSPYETPTTNDSTSAPSPTKARGPSTIRTTLGVILLVIAGLSLRGVRRPTNSTGSLADDLPFIGGQLFVTAAVAAVGLFLLLKKPSNAK